MTSALVCDAQGQTDQLRAAIMAHRASFITEADFATMAASDVNAVRLPVGHWALDATAVRASPARPPAVFKGIDARLQRTDVFSTQWHCCGGSGATRSCLAAPWQVSGIICPLWANNLDCWWQDQASPFMEGASAYIDLAMTWGAKHGVGILLDVQAAPGSQNG